MSVQRPGNLVEAQAKSAEARVRTLTLTLGEIPGLDVGMLVKVEMELENIVKSLEDKKKKYISDQENLEDLIKYTELLKAVREEKARRAGGK